MIGSTILRVAAAAVVLAGPVAARADPVPTTILFVGNSFTHGKYDPVRTYNSGFGTGTGNVHDQNCLTAATCSSAELTPATPPATGTAETGPYGGLPGIFLQLTKEAGLNYDVSINAVSAATLLGTSNSASRVKAIQTNPLTGKPFNTVVLQEQSFSPLPNPNSLGNTTRGNFANFVAGTNALVTDILATNAAAKVFLYETHPLASYVYASSQIQGSSTGPLNQPYIGGTIETLGTDLHNAYAADAAQNPGVTGVAFAGDAWVRAIQAGVAQRNPFDATQPAGQVDLWDSDVNAACCTTPIGYHPSIYGSYLSAVVLFDEITGLKASAFGGTEQAAAALGLTPSQAIALQRIAEATVVPEAVPEPSGLGALAAGLAGLLAWRRRA